MASKLAWFRREFATEPSAWLALVVAATSLVALGQSLPLVLSAPLWGGFVVVLAFRLRTSLPKLLGPVFLYDLFRTARRNQQIAHRAFYAMVLLLVLSLVFWSWFPSFDWYRPFQEV